ncbi:MAG: ATP-dependent helicase [Candidatus Micrarchaeota archaeon]
MMEQKKIPKPDFFLEDYDIIIEHWALDRNKKVPDWFETSSDDYNRFRTLKINKFKTQKKYSLVETFTYEFNDSKFYEKLKEKIIKTLKEKNPGDTFVIKKLSYSEFIESLKEKSYTLSNNCADFIKIAKTYSLTPEKIKERLESEIWSEKIIAFGNIANQIFKLYQKALSENGEIDFNDMINLAIAKLQQNKQLYRNKFDQILVDEYQDFSKPKFNLIKELMKKNAGCKLFCVGDDWQGIYAFSGANLEYFLQFENYFCSPTINYLTTNYRSNKSIVELGNAIIKMNGASQRSKKIKANNTVEKEITVYSLSHKKDFKKEYYHQMAEHCIELASTFPLNDVMILSRIHSRNSYLVQELLKASKKKE